jgi:hypothetical protein
MASLNKDDLCFGCRDKENDGQTMVSALAPAKSKAKPKAPGLCAGCFLDKHHGPCVVDRPDTPPIGSLRLRARLIPKSEVPPRAMDGPGVPERVLRLWDLLLVSQGRVVEGSNRTIDQSMEAGAILSAMGHAQGRKVHVKHFGTALYCWLDVE